MSAPILSNADRKRKPYFHQMTPGKSGRKKLENPNLGFCLIAQTPGPVHRLFKDPLFPFGFGLSYSRFRYSDFKVEATEGIDGILAKAQICVTNESERPGKETVQLYIHDVAAQVIRPVKELKGFRKLELQPGESAVVSFDITEQMLSYWNEERQFVFEPGEFDIMLGSSSADVESARVWIS